MMPPTAITVQSDQINPRAANNIHPRRRHPRHSAPSTPATMEDTARFGSS